MRWESHYCHVLQSRDLGPLVATVNDEPVEYSWWVEMKSGVYGICLRQDRYNYKLGKPLG